MKNKLFAIILLLLAHNLYSQGSAGGGATFETRDIVDMPTAGVLPKNDYAVDLLHYENGGIAFSMSYGLWRNFNIGGSISLGGLVGSQDVSMQSVPSIIIKYRFINETMNVPAFAVGVSTRGTGKYNNSSNRFEIASPGIFLSLSKSFLWDLGYLGLHAGVNYSFENVGDDFFVNTYVGLEQAIGRRFAINLEYNAGAFEWEARHSRGHGFLHSSLRYSLGYGFTMQMQFRDLLDNFKNSKNITSYFAIEWIGKI